VTGDRRPTRLLVVDLDGTVRHGFDELGRFVNGPEDIVVFPEAVARMREWRDLGGRVVGLSNQGGVALGLVTAERVYAAAERTRELSGHLMDSVAWCPHHPAATDPEKAFCWCRKPSPGGLVRMIVEMEAAYGECYPPHMGLFVGDRDEDRRCAELAGFPFAWAADWRAEAAGSRAG
jgi:D-glycero-D-manno-heptose 1,7-bisphosphate phosphatase